MLLGMKLGENVLLSRTEFGLEDVDLLVVHNGAFIGAGPKLAYLLNLASY